MCGICFIYNSIKDAAQLSLVDPMVACLAHRGPDAQHTKILNHVGLGHSRLSIVDIKGGTQPMTSTDGRFTISYNGELYNFVTLQKELKKKGVIFNTHCDTEVVLNMYIAYGKECVSYLRGMFAFTVYDHETDELFIARDRLGIKPLFYHWNGSSLIGGSEIKAIFASGLVEPRLNLYSIANYFKYQFSVAPNTPFEDIVELEAGHTISINPGGKPELQQYWDLEFPRDDEYESREEWEWEAKLQDGLDDAVISHMIGDVPIGAYLSGGIDSATTTYMLNKHYDNPVQSFTIEFTNKANDESDIAKSIAQHIKVPNAAMVLDDERTPGYLKELVDAIYHLEQPQRVAVDIPHFMLSDFVRSQNYKVVYTGDGADEIFGGYDCYRQDMIRIWGNQKASKKEREEYYLNSYTENFSDLYMRHLLRLHEPERQEQTINYFGCYPVWFDTWQILVDEGEKLLSDETKGKLFDSRQMDELVARVKPKIEGRHRLNQSLYIETKTRLVNWILWKSDRLSMSHSVEARVPFMDHKLVELAAKIPPDLKLNGMDEKYLLKKIMAEHMPQHPQQFKKRAFYTPIKEWFFTSEKIKDIESFISEEVIKNTGIFDSDAVKEMVDEIIRFETPQTYNDYYSLMKLEWGLMVVLTVQILHWLFVEKNAACFEKKTL
jgi:asparagine synthase (glutamine-hydrolysing)